MSKKIIAVIPVKKNSERVKNKNFRKFYKNLSLFQIKLIQLVRSKQFDRIIVSSDSLDARKISAKYNGVEFYYREKKFCNNKISWSNVINEVLDGKEINKEDIISWCHVTSPFFKNYKSMLEKFKKCKKNDSMLTLQENKSFILNENLKPINYQFGKWHDYSQNLPKYYFSFISTNL